FKPPNPALAIVIPSGVNPGLRPARLVRLRVNRSAHATSTRDSATCTTTNARRRLKRSRLAVNPRPLALIAADGATRVARNAGVRPNKMQVAPAIDAAKAIKRQSKPKS